MTDPPRHVTDAARLARTMRLPGSTVADISYDSVLDDTDSTPAERRITFRAEGMEVGVVVRPVGERLELLIHVQPASVNIVRTFEGGAHTLDSSGTARLYVEPGLTSLVLEPTEPGTRVVQTAWISL
jgi:hypothetical protein